MAATNETLVEQLTAMKAKIDAARVDKAKLEGQLAGNMARLKELGFDSVEAAEDRLETLQAEIARLDESVRRGVAELHDKYGL